MAPDKSPAFQFYPRDWDTDVNVIPMTYEEEGVYWALLRLMWLNESLPASLDDLRMLLKGRPTLKRMQLWWKRIGPCFQERDGRLHHRRIQREREAQAESRRRRAEAAARRWERDAMHQQSSSNADAKQCSASASASATSTASATAVKRPASNASTSPIVSSPLEWHKVHGKHVPEFCDWVCLPQFVFDKCVTRVLGSGVSEEAARSQVLAWARQVRQEWQGRVVGDDELKFWRDQWAAAHPTPKASASKPDLSAVIAKLDGRAAS